MPYNGTQTGFVLAMLAYLGDTIVVGAEPFETAVARQIENQLSFLRPQIGGWQLVWGPAFLRASTLAPSDNVMHVARGIGTPGQQQLVVAIAGTNPFSLFDWLIEDLAVGAGDQVAWPGAAGGKISKATSTGLGVLQNMQPAAPLAGAGQRLRDFLAAQAAAGPVAINVAGHSLGGALSSTLALWLHDTRTTWDSRGHASLSALSFAGPTAGNQAFAEYSDAQLGPRVNRIHNSLDIVPHVWASADLQRISALYQPEIEPGDPIDLLVRQLVTRSSGGGYTQINANASPLVGTLEQLLIVPGIPLVVGPGNFFAQAVHQHVDAYCALLQVQAAGLSNVLSQARAKAKSLSDLIAQIQRLVGLNPFAII